MGTIKLSFLLAEHLAKGLADGTYVRVGGVIRDVATKQLVAWLREAFDVSRPVLPSLLQPTTAGILNLAISTMGFAIVMKRLSVIEERLRETEEILLAINNKIDMSFYANFQAALDLATNAFTMSNTETRRVSETQAINRFLEAEYHYTKLADTQIDAGSQAGTSYLATLCLAYVTEARCYLELDELETAHRRLREGLIAVRPRLQKYVNILLTSNPAVYLHPSLKNQITLRRLTKTFQWMNPDIDESELFEAQRENLFKVNQSAAEWIDSLPQAIKISPGREISVQSKSKWPDWSRKANKQGLINLVNSLKAASSNALEYYSRLPAVLETIEVMIEDDQRLEAYTSEIETILQLGVSFQEWRRLTPAPGSPGSESGLMYINLA